MRWMQDTFLSPGAKGRGRLVFVGFFPRRQETGTGPVLPEEAASQSQWRGQKFPHHVCSYTHTYTKHSWMCIYKQRRAHPQIIRPDTHESNSMRSLPAASSCLPRGGKIIFPFHFPSLRKGAEAAPLWLHPRPGHHANPCEKEEEEEEG